MKHKIEVGIEEVVKTIRKEIVEVSTAEFIGLKLKEFRFNNNLTQLEVTERVSFSRANLSNIESGRFNITLNALEELCQIYKCKASDILPF
jgi:transcriptional regulator with XRE-family HTH domain